MLPNNLLEKLKLLPWKIIFLFTAISLIGLILLYNASISETNTIFKKQIIYFFIFLPIMVIIALSDINLIFNLSYYSYALALILLILGSLMGYKAMGATRWIDIGIIKFQPSELMKIGIILALARYFHSTEQKKISQIKSLIIPIILVILPLAIVLKQPDLGTAIVIAIVSTITFFLAGVKASKFIFTMITLVGSLPFIWRSLHAYQKKRILVFLDPELDLLGAGYNITQSKIAIGSGGLFGKGRLISTQAKLGFLPEHHTDFIFALFAEEFGFIGSIILLALYFFLIIEIFYIATRCKNSFGRLVMLGLISIFTTHVIINLGMVIGLLPVVGITLPLLSSGGTAMGVIMISFGIILNISLNSNSRIAHNRLGYLF